MKRIMFVFLILTLAAMACGGGDPVLDEAMRTAVPAAATEAANLPQTVVEAAGQAALDASMTTADLTWEVVLGNVPCRDARLVEIDSGLVSPSEYGEIIQVKRCGPPTPEEAREELLYDLAATGVAVFATPSFPVDDVFFIVNVGKSFLVVVGVTAGAYLAERGLVAMASRHTDSEHDPYKKGSIAEAIVLDFVARWPNGPDNQDWICATIYAIRGTVKVLARTVYWNKMGTGYGDLAWYDHLAKGGAGKWGGAYGYKLQETVGKLPKSLQDSKEQYTIESGCGGGPMPPLATN